MSKIAIVLIGFIIVSVPNYSCCLQTLQTVLVYAKCKLLKILTEKKKNMKK